MLLLPAALIFWSSECVLVTAPPALAARALRVSLWPSEVWSYASSSFSCVQLLSLRSGFIIYSVPGGSG